MYRIIPVLLFLMILFSCTEDKDFESHTVGDNFVKSGVDVAYIDTFKVEMSTFMKGRNSRSTANAPYGLIGNYIDSELGKVQASSYFKMRKHLSDTLNDKDVYDSITVRMRFVNEVFGDTLKLQEFQVSKLTEELLAESSESYAYNDSYFPYENEPLGTFSFKHDSVSTHIREFRLNDSFGQELFDMVLNDSEYLENDETFFRYLPGIAITSTTEDASIFKFAVADSSFYINLYSHAPEDEDSTVTRFRMITPAEQYNMKLRNFNRIVSDRTGSSSEQLLLTDNIGVESGQTANRTFIQGGIGYNTHISLPDLYKLLELDKKRYLMKAELVIKPIVETSVDTLLLPTALALYNSNRSNIRQGAVQDLGDDDVIVNATVTDDDEIQYVFDLTKFIQEELADGIFDENHGLIIGLGSEDENMTMERVVISDSPEEDLKPVLKLYYVFYE